VSARKKLPEKSREAGAADERPSGDQFVPEVSLAAAPAAAVRRKLPDERPSVTRKIKIVHAREDRKQLIDQLQDRIERARRAPDKEAADGVLGEPVVVRKTVEVIKIYVQVGLYPDTGEVGEVFLKADRMGSSISGLLDALSMAVSVGLQSGVPLRWFVEKLRNMQFEPSGTVMDDPDLKKVTSVVDAVARWLGKRFLDKDEDPGPTGQSGGGGLL
jgi:hypothetical protein